MLHCRPKPRHSKLHQPTVRRSTHWQFWTTCCTSRQYDQAVALADRTVALMRSSGIHLFLPGVRYLEGEIRLARGQIGEALTLLRQAHREAEQQTCRRARWPILATLIRLEKNQGVGSETELLTHNARANIQHISRHITDPDLRQSFLELPDVRLILANKPIIIGGRI